MVNDIDLISLPENVYTSSIYVSLHMITGLNVTYKLSFILVILKNIK